MREQLNQYIDLLFAGATEAADMKEEILQNTLDRYDDLIAQGKTPEAAYRLCISGIGDINTLLGTGQPEEAPPAAPAAVSSGAKEVKNHTRLVRAVAVAFFILCPVPLLILEDTIGLCLLLAMVAAGVALLVFNNKEQPEAKSEESAQPPLLKTLTGILWGIGTAGYFLLSFASGAWYITWLIFPITACLSGIVSACFYLRAAFLKAVLRIVIYAILTTVMTAMLLGTYLGVNVYSFISDEVITDGTLSSSGSVSAASIRDIEVQWVSGSITVQKGAVQDIEFSETSGLSEDQKLVWKQSGDRLILQFSKPQVFPFFSFGVTTNFSKDLLITVPENWTCDELDIDSVSARITVTDLTAQEMELVNVSGTCEIEGCAAGQLNAETVSGSVSYQGKLEELDFSTVSADCVLTLENSPAEIDLESVSGDLTLILPEDCGFTVKLDSVSGDFTSDFPTTGSDKSFTYGNGSCRITADSVSGDIRIRSPK